MQDGSLATSVPQWWLHNDGHVLAGAIAVRENGIEAQILLDGSLLYGSRHASIAKAESELATVRGQCTSDGWR